MDTLGDEIGHVGEGEDDERLDDGEVVGVLGGDGRDTDPDEADDDTSR